MEIPDVQHQLESSAPVMNKQAYIYKKNPKSATKAITRKMRTTATLAQDPYADNPIGKTDEARTDQNDGQTLATQGQQSGISPRTAALSQDNF